MTLLIRSLGLASLGILYLGADQALATDGVVPEPTSVILLGTGVGALIVWRVLRHKD